MRRRLALAGLVLLLAGGCTPPSGQNLNTSALDDAIGRAIGDPTTCVLLADRASGKVVYRYGDQFGCARTYNACDRAGVLNAVASLRFATQPGGRLTSCASVPDGSRNVGWAAGRLPSGKRDLVYAAVMEGDRALPGREMADRLADAFSKAGL